MKEVVTGRPAGQQGLKCSHLELWSGLPTLKSSSSDLASSSWMCLLQFQWSPEPLVFVYEYEDENQARIRHYKLETQTVGQDISKNGATAAVLSGLYRVVCVVLQQEGCRFHSKASGLSVLRLDVAPASAWLLSRYSGFLPPCRHMKEVLLVFYSVATRCCGCSTLLKF